MCKGRDYETGEEVALKMEHVSSEAESLKSERHAYHDLQGLVGFPKLIWFGGKDAFTIMALELLGPSVHDLLLYCGGRFSLKTTLMLVDQLLTRLKDMHSRGFVHRDLKSSNVLLGTGLNGNTVYLTDFGTLQAYTSSRATNGDQEDDLEPRNGRFTMTGTPHYASIRAHVGRCTSGSSVLISTVLIGLIAQSQRDDLESLGYMIIELIKGRLPWAGLKVEDENEKHKTFYEMKKSMTPQVLFEGLPQTFADYMTYVKSLSYCQMPDYAYLQQSLRHLAEQEGIEYDNVYDWTERLYLESKMREDGAEPATRKPGKRKSRRGKPKGKLP